MLVQLYYRYERPVTIIGKTCTEPESCSLGVTTTTSFWQFNFQIFAVQLVGDANIEQYVTETTCINVIYPTLKVGICVPTDYTKQIIV